MMWHVCGGCIRVIRQKHDKGECPTIIYEHYYNGLRDGDWQRRCKGFNQNQNGSWVFFLKKNRLSNLKVDKELRMMMDEEFRA